MWFYLNDFSSLKKAEKSVQYWIGLDIERVEREKERKEWLGNNPPIIYD